MLLVPGILVEDEGYTAGYTMHVVLIGFLHDLHPE